MRWREITVATNSMGADLVAETLRNLGAEGVQIIDRADIPDPSKPHGHWELIDESLLSDMPEEVEVKAWFLPSADLSSLAETLTLLPEIAGFPLDSLQVRAAFIQDENWQDTWKQYYKPLHLGKNLVVRPSWEAYEANEHELVIRMDPGMAFGTGSHETTQLCLELIEKVAPDELLDVGTGSGILAIAAAKMGAQNITAVDIDPDAVRTAKENVRLNGLEGVIKVREGDLIKGINQKFSCVAVNILADVIIFLLPALPACLKKGGVAILSGILESRLDEVLKVTENLPFTALEIRKQNDWCALLLRYTG